MVTHFADNVSGYEDHTDTPRGVNFFVVKRPKEASAREQELACFEATILPHIDAAKNLACWLVRNERDAEDVAQEAYLRAFKSFGGFHGTNGRAWLLTIVRNTSYTFLKKNRTSEFVTSFDEEIHDASMR